MDITIYKSLGGRNKTIQKNGKQIVRTFAIRTIKSSIAGIKKVEIFDISEKQVLKMVVKDNQLAVSRLKTGIYIMKIGLQENTTIVKKMNYMSA